MTLLKDMLPKLRSHRETRQQQVSKARIKRSPFRSAVRESLRAGLDTAGRGAPSSSSGAPQFRGSGAAAKGLEVKAQSWRARSSRLETWLDAALAATAPAPVDKWTGSRREGGLFGPGERPSFFQAAAEWHRASAERGRRRRAGAGEDTARAWRRDIAGIAASSLSLLIDLARVHVCH
ncbi:hypothetical protein HPB50_006342 [Hyalomma asiaticum]|uniref:Uncharacterized protein n=1 Tax=Hyalomma asiaticum TaxID=266040 RepID=A0ACB7S369_HYAAI|nr:hypothetical protein HPB50_006342 [Hyalomma asiaticum]